MKDDRKYLTEFESALLDSFPGLTQEELDAANDLFEPYIFYTSEKGGRRLWTSCCHRDGELVTLPARTETPELRDVLSGKHNDAVTCPWCGKKATLKCRGRAKRLTAEGNVVFLCTDESGGIFAQSYWMNKNYGAEPAGRPRFCASSQYRFEPGAAIEFNRDYGQWYSSVEQGNLMGKRKVVEPFYYGSCMRVMTKSYAVIGIEELERSFARWCDYPAWRAMDAAGEVLYDDLIRFLCVAAVYPHQLEWLVKTRQRTLINDLIWEGKKNAKVFKWSETDPRRAFGLSKGELKAYLTQGDALAMLYAMKLLKCSFAEAEGWFGEYTGIRNLWEMEDFCKTAKERQISPAELRKYLERFTGWRCGGRGYFTLMLALSMWRDYLANAAACGFDLTQRSVMYPRDLEGAHNNAMMLVLKANEAKNAEKRKAQQEKAAARRLELDAAYGFESLHYIIRAPVDAAEIVAEGKILHHCVGGYADRHVEGACTILFLRDRDEPDKPLCTIEVDGDRIRQIHGFQNDRGSAKPELRFAEIYEPFKAWMDAGRPRRDDGTPRVPGNKQKKEVRVA